MNRSLLKVLIVATALFLATIPADGALTMDQLLQTMDMMRQACQPKTKATDADIEAIREKVFADNREIKCFSNCVLEMMNVIKKGKIQYDAAIRSLQALAPEDVLDDQVQAFKACAESPKGIKDNCEAAYTFLQCQSAAAQNFIFT